MGQALLSKIESLIFDEISFITTQKERMFFFMQKKDTRRAIAQRVFVP
ncbi:hypothetical protein [Aquibacillus koreensis]|nr:hypothetical protein [Aquibacillus koreensis]